MCFFKLILIALSLKLSLSQSKESSFKVSSLLGSGSFPILVRAVLMNLLLYGFLSFTYIFALFCLDKVVTGLQSILMLRLVIENLVHWAGIALFDSWFRSFLCIWHDLSLKAAFSAP